MADRSMKAVIRAEVDPSGVVKGVATANKELQKLSATTAKAALASGISATIDAGQVAFSGIRTAVTALDKRADELTKITTTFNVDAANAATQSEIEKYARNKRIADALAPGVIQGIQNQDVIANKQADYVVQNAARIGQGIANVQGISAGGEAATNQMLDVGLQGAGTTTLDDIRDTLRKFSGWMRGQP
jgi:hypothetical protein